MITLDEAIESAKLAAGSERILRQQHYEDLLRQRPDEERYSFTLALAELNIGPRTGHREASSAVAEFLGCNAFKEALMENTGLTDCQIEEKLVKAAMRRDAQWWQNLKQRFKDWWEDDGPQDEFEEEFGEPFPYREPGTEDLYETEPEEVIAPGVDLGPKPPDMPIPEAPPFEAPPFEAPPLEAPPLEAPPLEAPPTEPPGFGDKEEIPEMIPVESSNLESIGYDPAENLLYIIFTVKKNTPRTLYRYSEVSQGEFDGLLTGVDGSVGKYYWRHIRSKPYTGPLDPAIYRL